MKRKFYIAFYTISAFIISFFICVYSNIKYNQCFTVEHYGVVSETFEEKYNLEVHEDTLTVDGIILNNPIVKEPLKTVERGN